MSNEENSAQLTIPKWARWLFAFLALSAVVVSFVLASRQSPARLSDFAGYYTAARILLSGDSISSLYDDDQFKRNVKKLGLEDSTIVLYVNPPPVSFLMVPLELLKPDSAKTVWNLFTIALAFIAVYLARDFSLVPARSGTETLFFALLVCSIPFLRNLQRGQVYVMMTVLVLILWKGYASRNAWLTGSSLALLLLLKYFGWIFLITLAWEKRWKEVAATAFSLVIFFMLSVAAVGIETYRQHFIRLAASFQNLDVARSGLPSVPAFFGSIFVFDARWNPAPLANISGFAIFLTGVSLAMMLLLTLRRRVEHDPGAVVYRFSGLTVLAVLFTPLAAEHHYVLLSIPLFVVLTSIPRKDFMRILLFAATTYLVLGWLPALSIQSSPGWMKLLSFGRLYGGISLWFMLVLAPRVPLFPPAHHAD